MNILSPYLEQVETDYAYINYQTEAIVWKPGKFTPKLRNDILYWFKERRKSLKN